MRLKVTFHGADNLTREQSVSREAEVSNRLVEQALIAFNDAKYSERLGQYERERYTIELPDPVHVIAVRPSHVEFEVTQ